jgi:hypothetical protein
VSRAVACVQGCGATVDPQHFRHLLRPDGTYDCGCRERAVPLTPTNVVRALNAMMDGTRERATFTFTITRRHIRRLEPRPGSLLDLAHRLTEDA